MTDTFTENIQRAGALAGQLAQVQAELVEFTTELLATEGWRGVGFRSPEHWLSVYTGLAPVQCKQIVRIAERAAELPTVRRFMHEGRLTADQAAPIAEHIPEYAEPRAAKFAELATVSQVRRVTRNYEYRRIAKPHEYPKPKSPARPAHLQISKMDQRFRLTFDTNLADGALVEEALKEAKDALFNSGTTDANLADAFMEVASRSLASVASASRREHYKVIIHLDTDGRAWVNKQGALPSELMEAFTCDGRVRPVWETDGVPVSVGRSQRIVPVRTRKLIEDRDCGCRFPGCAVTQFLENHHLTHWSKGGRTDIDSLISLCPYHHREHHLDAFTIEGNPNVPDGLRFYDTHGRLIARHIPDEIPPPEKPPPIREGIRGETYDPAFVDFGIPPDGDPFAPSADVPVETSGGDPVIPPGILASEW